MREKVSERECVCVFLRQRECVCVLKRVKYKARVDFVRRLREKKQKERERERERGGRKKVREKVREIQREREGRALSRRSCGCSSMTIPFG